MKDEMQRSTQSLIIKRIEDNDHDGHHGGAWKVAYADFMTAMMAFFLLLWILSSSDEQKLKGIAEYFTNATLPGGLGVLDGASIGPPGILNASNGVVMARGSEIDEQSQTLTVKWEVRDATSVGNLQVAQARDAIPSDEVNETADGILDKSAGDVSVDLSQSEAPLRSSLERGTDEKILETTPAVEDLAHSEDDRRFAEFQSQIVQAMQANPDLRPLKENVIFQKSNDGLNVQIIDQEGQPMFASGSAKVLPAMQQLLGELARNLAQLPNQLMVTGHTDAIPFSSNSDYDNWDLSTDRANEARRILVNSGIRPERLSRVSGRADTDPLVADDPNNPSNRRITLFLEYERQSTNLRKPIEHDLDPKIVEPHVKDEADVTRLDEETLESLRSVLR